jgi:hypothetical protein
MKRQLTKTPVYVLILDVRIRGQGKEVLIGCYRTLNNEYNLVL